MTDRNRVKLHVLLSAGVIASALLQLHPEWVVWSIPLAVLVNLIWIWE